MATNRELNQAHEAREQARVRPKGPEYNSKPLEEVMRVWAQASRAALVAQNA